MLFQVVLASVMVYLAACYAYGLVLLFKLYANRRQQSLAGTVAHSGVEFHEPAAASPAPTRPQPRPAAPAYHAPAKAA